MRFRTFAPVMALFIVIFSSFPASSNAEAPSADVQRGIQTVILKQIAAFKADDAKAAFSIAAPNIQQRFGSSTTFMRMVKQGYGAIYRASYIEFGPLIEIDSDIGRYVQHVVVEGTNARVMMAVYAMERDASGAWRIAGCSITPMKREST